MQSKSIVIVSMALDKPGALALRDVARQLGHTAEIVTVTSDDIVEKLHQADVRLYRISPDTYETYIALLPELQGPSRQEVAAALRGFDKAASYELLHDNDIPTPESYRLGRGDTPLSYPAVVKILHSNQGKGVELVTDGASYRSFESAYPYDVEFLVQEFIEEAGAADKRLFVVGDSVVAAMIRRSVTDDFRANLHMGGVAEAYHPTDQEIEIAVRTVRTFDIPYAGVDIIDSNKGPLVLEVNPSPGFAVGEVAGVDIPRVIVQEVTQ